MAKHRSSHRRRHHRRNPEGGKSMLPWILGGGAVLLLLRGGSGSASGIFSAFLPSTPGAAPTPIASGTAQFAIPGVASLASMLGSLVPNINTGGPTAGSLGLQPIAPAISPVVTIAPVTGVTSASHDMTAAQHAAALSLHGMTPPQRAAAVGVPYPVYNVDEATATHYRQLMYPGLRLPWGPGTPYPTYSYFVHISQITRMTPDQATAGIVSGQIDMSDPNIQNSITNTSAVDDIGNELGNDTNPKKGIQIRDSMVIQYPSGIFGYLWLNTANPSQYTIWTGWPLLGPGPGWREATKAEVDAIGPSLGPNWQWPDEFSTQMAAAQSNPLYQGMYVNTNQPNA